MKKLSVIVFSALLMAGSFGVNAFADHDPILCNVEINYRGQDYGGHDDADTEKEALNDAKEEACERACRMSGDACEKDCMRNADIRSQSCRNNQKQLNNDKDKDSDEYFCRVLIQYQGQELDGYDSEHSIEKAGRDAVEDACDQYCENRPDEDRCERDCRINASVLGMGCTDRNKKPVHQQGRFAPKTDADMPVPSVRVNSNADSDSAFWPFEDTDRRSSYTDSVQNEPSKPDRKKNKKNKSKDDSDSTFWPFDD